MASTGNVHLGLPSPSLFSFPPNPDPAFIPPAAPGSMASAPPFHIPDHIYQSVLDPKVPITIAAVYAVTIKSLNAYNKSTNRRPWAISKTRPFFWFVVLHNVFLAVYSAWTFWGMIGTMRRAVVSPFGPDGLAGTVDSFCRLQGPAGLGNAAFYDESINDWNTYAPGVSVAGGPSRTVPGRIWNEGLAFYGWIFYLSKFYEVLDTFIILAKGKLSSTLQTYHHAGAMMCMWAGMRYMSAPIWMFAFYNSGIHAMMYTYYTVTAFSVKVPVFIKRSLTTMQITQFLIGASYAMLHSFVSYNIPVIMTGEQAVQAAASVTASSAAVDGSATEAIIDGLRNIIGGVVGSKPISTPVPEAATAAVTGAVSYGQRVVPCITGTGESFAIWLNVVYLAPLTYLFVKFFIESYIRRSTVEAARHKKGVSARRESNVTMAEQAGWDAAREMEKEVYGESGNGKAANGTR
ncbi:hypothetical protein MAPG_07891 [Magnaporthiopsis poae ATCC 64411]|uniref:Elongation of fatty acids protein n=1 Tax=Magnaporthiopsis poae (strain ATCC 64411 / 73-15) TaxID=644358 RepID=A0A0C4E5W4_MAGP6|nr:hypothetical protein MAPG_07891 [Magnaporthiopsis poae ATCC 64411]